MSAARKRNSSSNNNLNENGNIDPATAKKQDLQIRLKMRRARELLGASHIHSHLSRLHAIASDPHYSENARGAPERLAEYLTPARTFVDATEINDPRLDFPIPTLEGNPMIMNAKTKAEITERPPPYIEVEQEGSTFTAKNGRVFPLRPSLSMRLLFRNPRSTFKLLSDVNNYAVYFISAHGWFNGEFFSSKDVDIGVPYAVVQMGAREGLECQSAILTDGLYQSMFSEYIRYTFKHLLGFQSAHMSKFHSDLQYATNDFIAVNGVEKYELIPDKDLSFKESDLEEAKAYHPNSALGVSVFYPYDKRTSGPLFESLPELNKHFFGEGTTIRQMMEVIPAYMKERTGITCPAIFVFKSCADIKPGLNFATEEKLIDMTGAESFWPMITAENTDASLYTYQLIPPPPSSTHPKIVMPVSRYKTYTGFYSKPVQVKQTANHHRRGVGTFHEILSIQYPRHFKGPDRRRTKHAYRKKGASNTRTMTRKR